jgi:hypothetical protein
VDNPAILSIFKEKEGGPLICTEAFAHHHGLLLPAVLGAIPVMCFLA